MAVIPRKRVLTKPPTESAKRSPGWATCPSRIIGQSDVYEAIKDVNKRKAESPLFNSLFYHLMIH